MKTISLPSASAGRDRVVFRPETGPASSFNIQGKIETVTMQEPLIASVAIIGSGVIGRGWINVFSAAGCRTLVFDSDSAQLQRGLAWFNDTLAQDEADGFIDAERAVAMRSRVIGCNRIEDALDGVGYVQESIPEQIAVKREIFGRIDRIAAPSTIIASSSSALDINRITEGLAGASRCILAHPFNPPHVIPAVEVLPGRKTAPEVVRQTLDFLANVGQVPVLMNFFVTGFLGNRIQAAVVREAIHLVESGVASVEAVDAVICHGMGLRWALLGNFGVNNTNADGGIREYYQKYGKAYQEQMLALDAHPPDFDPAMIARIAAGVDRMEHGASVADICRWRDRLVRNIRRLKTVDPHPGSAVTEPTAAKGDRP